MVGDTTGAGKRRGLIRSPQDLAGGIFLITIAVVGYFATLDLNFGSLANIGSGLLPRSVAILLAIFGVMIAVSGFLFDGSALDRWSIRGPFFVLGAALLFAWAIRPLGLIVAGPLAIAFASLADKDTRLIEIIVFTVVMTAVCIGLFSFLLRLPIPIWPTSAPFPLDMLVPGRS